MTMKQLLAGAGAIALIGAGALIGASPAQAAPSVTVTPNSNLKGGDVVTVTYQGFSPNAPVAVGVCPTPRIDKITGPGDCGRSKNGHSKLTTADASGKGTAQITIPQGKLDNATPPAATCPPCSIGLTNIGNQAEKANVELKYASAGGNAAPEPKAKAPDDSAAPPAEPKELVQTGPRETLITALIGFSLFQLGLMFADRAHRSSPRRSVP